MIAGRWLVGRVSTASVALLLIIAACAPAGSPSSGAPKEGFGGAGAPAAASPPTAVSSQPATGSAATSPPRVSSEVTKIGHLGGGTDFGIILAESLGFYQEQGLAVEQVVVKGVPEGLPLLATNQLQALGGAPSASVFNAIGRGAGVRIVADRAQVQPGRSAAPLIARKSLQGQVNGPSDLFGKRVATSNEAGSSWVGLYRYVTDAGLNFKDLDIVLMPFPDMVPALSTGHVDLATVIEPFASAAVNTDVGFQVVDEYSMYPGHQVGVLMYGNDFINQREEDARRLTVAYLKGVRAYLDAFGPGRVNREQVVRALVENTSLKDPALYEVMTPSAFEPNGQVNVASLEYDLNYFVAAGYVKDPPTIQESLDLRFVNHALAVLGRR
jgi:NitT/TauT family transport system substrate-binding protein